MRVEAAWRALEADRARGTIMRIDREHPSAFYATLDYAGHRGLMLSVSTEPHDVPALKSLTVNTVAMGDATWQVYFWLANDELGTLFAALCDDLVEASRLEEPSGISAFVTTRLARWRRLLEPGGLQVLPMNELRGLIGELAVLWDSFSRANPADAVLAWQGPFDAPQDFAFPQMVIETKTAGPTALRVHVGSSDQLDAPYNPQLILALVLLAPAAIDVASGFSVADYVSQFRATLVGYPHALEEFNSRLRAAGYSDDADYAEVRFRIDGLRYFRVGDGFPRLIRADLMPGIADAAYEIELSAIASFEVTLRV